MKAYLLKRHGGTSVLKLGEVADPNPPAPGEVTIRNRAIGLNYAEILSRKGQYSWAPKKPYTLGMECFGEIVAVGSGVTDRKVGDRVLCGMQYGSYAEYVKVPAYMTFPEFEGWSLEENAAVLVNYITAWIAMFEQARVRPEDTVLVEAAAGGVGTAAVQMLKAYGCTVVALAGNAEKIKMLEKMGADLAINYREADFEAVVLEKKMRPNVVLELVGGEVFKKSYRLLKPFGRMSVAGFASIPLVKWNPLTWIKTLRMAPKAKVMDMAQRAIGMNAIHVGYLIDQPELVVEVWGRTAEFLRKHNIRPVVGKTFSFREMAAAHEFIESRGSHGKVVVLL